MNKTVIRYPAEWEKHLGTVLAMPHQKADWPDKFAPIEWVYVDIIKNLVPYEEVFLIVKNEKQLKSIEASLERAHVSKENITFEIFDTNRSWMRDSSPSFVYKSNEEKSWLEAVHFKFNGWAKYGNWKKDYFIPEIISREKNLPLSKAMYGKRHVVLEGGAIDINGRGTLITTEECLMSADIQVRNKGFAKKDYEAMFLEQLGISNVIWLGKGIAGDDTHGHVDDLCRFVNPTTFVIASEDNPSDENYSILAENYERLQDARLEDGTKPEVVKLPMPAPIEFEDMRLPASYANFYIANEVVLVPTFNDPNDRKALNIIADLFPDRKIVGIHSVDLVWGLGTLHCLSHEIPAIK